MIMQNPNQQWYRHIVSNIVHVTCVIIHKMIIEDECNLDLEPCFEEHAIEMGLGLMFKQNEVEEIENCNTQFSLRNYLLEHPWACKGNSQIQ